MESQARIEAKNAGLDPMVGFLYQLRIDRLERELTRSVVGLVSKVEGLPAVLARLVEMLDHEPRTRPPHRTASTENNRI